MSISATMTVCDDIRFENNGKLMLIGGYTSDIFITNDDFWVNQLLFLFHVEGPLSEAPREITFEVTLPRGEAKKLTIPMANFQNTGERTRWYVRQIINFYHETLHPGSILARVLCDDQAMPVGAPWIVLPAPEGEAQLAPTP
jgi:hypothetical protein